MRCHRQLFSLAFGGLQHMLLGLMAAAFPVLPMGLLHMRPLLWWTKLLGIFLTGPASHLIKVSHSCFCALSIWWDPLFLQRGVSVGTAPCYQMVTMDASLRGWGTALLTESSSSPRSLEPRSRFWSWQKLRSVEWMLGRQIVAHIWEWFGRAEVDLCVSQ